MSESFVCCKMCSNAVFHRLTTSVQQDCTDEHVARSLCSDSPAYRVVVIVWLLSTYFQCGPAAAAAATPCYEPSWTRTERCPAAAVRRRPCHCECKYVTHVSQSHVHSHRHRVSVDTWEVAPHTAQASTASTENAYTDQSITTLSGCLALESRLLQTPRQRGDWSQQLACSVVKLH